MGIKILKGYMVSSPPRYWGQVKKCRKCKEGGGLKFSDLLGGVGILGSCVFWGVGLGKFDFFPFVDSKKVFFFKWRRTNKIWFTQVSGLLIINSLFLQYIWIPIWRCYNLGKKSYCNANTLLNVVVLFLILCTIKNKFNFIF